MDQHTDVIPPPPLEKWTEDLAWQAARGAELGRGLCTCEGSDHSLWSALRTGGLTDTLKSEEAQLSSLLSPLVQDRTRVLIGGSADTGVFCTLGRIAAPHQLDVTIIDKCPAPLALIEEFATLRDIPCTTMRAGIGLPHIGKARNWIVCSAPMPPFGSNANSTCQASKSSAICCRAPVLRWSPKSAPG